MLVLAIALDSCDVTSSERETFDQRTDLKGTVKKEGTSASRRKRAGGMDEQFHSFHYIGTIQAISTPLGLL